MKVKDRVIKFEQNEDEFKNELKQTLKDMCGFKLEDFPKAIRMLGIREDSYRVKMKEFDDNSLTIKLDTKEEHYKIKFFKVTMLVTAYCILVERKGDTLTTYRVSIENGVPYFFRM